jgi:hypothetical protein
MSSKSTAFLSLSLILIIVATECAEAQSEYLVLEKTFKKKQIHYSSGDNISYKLKEEDFFRTDHIISLNDTAIAFHYHQVLYHEIAEINIKGKRFTGANWRSIGSKLQFVGIAYIAIDQFNQVVVRGEDASFNQNVWISGGLIYLAGTIMKVTQPRKVKLRGKYRLRYMNVGY